VVSQITGVFRAAERGYTAKVMALEQVSGYLCNRLAAHRDLRQCRSAWVETSGLCGYDALGLRGVLELAYDQNDIT
jgi:hypothetical protein